MTDPRLNELHAAHAQFLRLVESLRPELHRYCARMTGSVIDGEDVVQEALTHAYYQLSQLREIPALRTWLFRIAHNRSLNWLSARARHAETEPVEELEELEEPEAGREGADAVLEHAEAAACAIGLFLELPPVQRACVLLKDVLDSSLEEVSETLELSIPAVKAALHRGRGRLLKSRAALRAGPPEPAHSPEVIRYVALFNQRDWDGVRRLLADDVRLDVVAREKRSGVAKVGSYFTNYGLASDWQLAADWLDGVEVIAVRRAAADARPDYVICLGIAEGVIRSIRDFRYAPRVFDEASFGGGPSKSMRQAPRPTAAE